MATVEYFIHGTVEATTDSWVFFICKPHVYGAGNYIKRRFSDELPI